MSYNRFKNKNDDKDDSYYREYRGKDAKRSRTEGQHSSDSTSEPNSSISTIVARHYNSINNKDISERLKSKIYFMRNFNNWIKSIIIRDTIQLLRLEEQNKKERKKDFVVLDLGCGKGGDLIKFQKSHITHLVCADIAEISIEHCKDRYKILNKNFTCEFISADCTRQRLQDYFANKSLKFDMTSCQFSFHYCFESYEQARLMVKNASESLKIGGIFCGTIPDSTEIIKRLKESGTNSYGNEVYSIKFPKSYDDYVKDGFPLFGTKYDFHLDEVVDCPEFLVYFSVFEEICNNYGLERIFKKRFDQFFLENKDDTGNYSLMNYMDTLEKYPPKDNEKLLGTAKDDYKHIRQFLTEQVSGQNINSLGTLSKSQWEAVTLYLVFSYRKVSDGPI